MKKICSVLFVIVMMASSVFCVNGENTDDVNRSYDGYIYMTVEKITLNQGLVQEPVKVGYNNDESLAEIMEGVLGDKSTFSGEISSYFLEGVKDGGEPAAWSTDKIPVDIQKALNYEIGERDNSDVLSAYDYSSYGGWQFTVDNHTTNVGAGQIYVGQDSSDGVSFENGSVIRLQYSLYGYGEDIGVSWGFCPFETTNTFADRGDLIKKVADINYEGTKNNYGEAYNYCNYLLTCWNISESEIENGVKTIEKAGTHTHHNYQYVKNGDGTHKVMCDNGEEEFTVNCVFTDDICEFCNTKRIQGLYGDCNLDGEVNIKDVTLLQKHLAQVVEMDETEIYFALAGRNSLNIEVGTDIQKWINHSLNDSVIGKKGEMYI